jgi:hypothetical protein
MLKQSRFACRKNTFFREKTLARIWRKGLSEEIIFADWLECVIFSSQISPPEEITSSECSRKGW